MTESGSPDPTARVVRVQTEVPARPEQVWRAIATGPGIATWFVPAEVDEREGGTITTHHGPYGDSVGTVTVWDPPHRFCYEERDWNPDDPDAPVWATETLVEARDGGTCIVRLASGFFHGGQGWEDQLDGTGEGWARGMVNLRLYLTHFAGEQAANLFVIGRVPGARAEVADALLAGLGLRDAAVGRRDSRRSWRAHACRCGRAGQRQRGVGPDDRAQPRAGRHRRVGVLRCHGGSSRLPLRRRRRRGRPGAGAALGSVAA
jgi:uncharacterized protein YndB with AHSA1/START domain